MAENNVIAAVYGQLKCCAVNGYRHTSYQYDYGQKLEFIGFPEGMIPDTFEVHFGIGNGATVTMIGQRESEDGKDRWMVDIPDQCLLKAAPIRCWLYLHTGEADGETRYEVEIPVRPRAAVTHEEPTPVQQSEITQAIAALNSAVEQTAADVTEVSGLKDQVEQAATDAEAAKTAAEAAQGIAEQAQESAELAAESAAESLASVTEMKNHVDEVDAGIDAKADGAIQDIEIAKENALSAVGSRQETAVAAVNSAKVYALSDMSAFRDATEDARDIAIEQSDIAVAAAQRAEASTESAAESAALAAQTTAEIEQDVSDLSSNKADKTGTVLLSTLSRGRKAGTTIGGASFAFGYNVEASGTESHAEGTNTVASGNNAHAEGGGSVASGLDSHAQGWRTIANHRSQTAIGECNVEDPSSADSEDRGTYVEIVGNGTGVNARSNARTLDWNGNEVLAGDLTVHAGDENEKTVGGLAREVSGLSDSVGGLRSALKEEIDIARVSSLDSTVLAKGTAIEAVGIPVYVDNVSQYAAYGITDKGWYVFARVAAHAEDSVTAQTTITGAAGYIATVGEDHIDLAVRFDTTAQSVPVTINWGTATDHFTFKASDLAVRNLDYRVTFYIYDIAPYAVWTYALTEDTTFTANKQYYTKDGDVYTLAEVTADEAIPADTYYNHSKLTFSGMVPNVTYKLDEIVDCPIEIVLPEVADDGHGAWFEIQMRYDATRSCTLIPPAGVKIGTAQTQAQSVGINTIDLQYTIAGEIKMWTLLNTHANIPA